MCAPACRAAVRRWPGWSVRSVWCSRSAARRSRSASVALRMACGGGATTTVGRGVSAPAGANGPPPRMQPAPIRGPGMRIAPLPISQRSPMVAPMTCARWPKTVRCPIRTGCSRVPTTTPFSRTAEWVPIDTDSSCDRTTVPWAMIAPAPTWTLPSSLAEPAISGCGWSANSRVRLMAAARPSEDVVAVHLAERVGDELDAGAVGVAEVHRDAAVDDVLHPGVGEPLHQLAPALRVDADGHVVQPAEHLGVGADVQAGEVEEGDEVAVANVEEEVRGAGVVAVLDELGQREAEHVLVEADGPLDVAADQRGVVQAAGGGRRTFTGWREVCGPDAGAFGVRIGWLGGCGRHQRCPSRRRFGATEIRGHAGRAVTVCPAQRRKERARTQPAARPAPDRDRRNGAGCIRG